jgi:hypothetical protein
MNKLFKKKYGFTYKRCGKFYLWEAIINDKIVIIDSACDDKDVEKAINSALYNIPSSEVAFDISTNTTYLIN